MRNLPQETIALLAIAAFWLLRWLYQRWRRTVRPVATPADAGPVLPEVVQSLPSPAPQRLPDPPAPAARRATPGPTPGTRRPRRFSRAALMPDRRAVQDAFVVATVLRPCHAHRPHGSE